VDQPVRLPEGRSGTLVWRSSRGVHRTVGPWTPTVHAYLTHLADAGYVGAPLVLGFDEDGRELLTFIEGEVLADPTWQPGQPGMWPEFARSEESLAAVGSLIRELHDVARDFKPQNPRWKQYDWPVLVGDEIVGHGDLGRHNTVYRDGLPVAFIDWDTIRPVHPIIEFGNAVWNFVPLGDERYFAASDFVGVPPLDERLALFAGAYGLTDRDQVLWGIEQAKQRHAENFRYWRLPAAHAAVGLQMIAEELIWLSRNQDFLLRRIQ
jgi:hypothetical protein